MIGVERQLQQLLSAKDAKRAKVKLGKEPFFARFASYADKKTVLGAMLSVSWDSTLIRLRVVFQSGCMVTSQRCHCQPATRIAGATTGDS